MFRNASKACAYVHHLTDKRIKQLIKNQCRACIAEATGQLAPHAVHVDGNLKLCRRHRDMQLNYLVLYMFLFLINNELKLYSLEKRGKCGLKMVR